jgi:hypothetical protein
VIAPDCGPEGAKPAPADGARAVALRSAEETLTSIAAAFGESAELAEAQRHLDVMRANAVGIEDSTLEAFFVAEARLVDLERKARARSGNGRPHADEPAACGACGRDSCAGDCGAEAGSTVPPELRLLRPLSASAIYADQRSETINWIWADMLPDGSLVVLGSYMKEGKTTLFYALVGAMMREASFLGRATRRVPVLILAVEEHVRDIKAHLREAGIGPDDPVFVHAGPLPLTREALGELALFIDSQQIGLVAVDTLGRLMLFKNENDNAEVTAKMAPLLDLCRGRNAALVMLHHTAKLGSEAFSYGRELRGAGAIFAVVDQALILKRVKGGSATARELRAVGRYRESPERLLIDFDPEAGAWTLLEDAERAGSRRETQIRKLLGYVAEHQGETRSEVVGGAKVKRSDGLELLRELIEGGRLDERTTPGGGYGLFLP